MYMTENITIRLSGKSNSQPVKRLADWLYAELPGCADGCMINGMIDRMGSRKADCSNSLTFKCSNGQPVKHFISRLDGLMFGYPFGCPACHVNNQPYV